MAEVPNQIVMRVIIRMIESVVSGSSFGPVETYTRENTRRTNAMVMVKCTGQMEVVIKESGLGGFNTATAE